MIRTRRSVRSSAQSAVIPIQFAPEMVTSRNVVPIRRPLREPDPFSETAWNEASRISTLRSEV